MSFRLPQYVYPSAATHCFPAAALAAQGLTLPQVSQSPLSPTAATANQLCFDYPTAAAVAGYPAAQLTAGGAAAAAAAYEGYPYTTAAAGYMANPQAYYTAVAQPSALGHFATTSHFQQQQLAAERLQWE